MALQALEQLGPEPDVLFKTHNALSFSSKSSRLQKSHGILPESEQGSRNEIPLQSNVL